jgi:uncharacterized phage-like protein YoqJ
VKGHGADLMNDLVDRLAVEAARTQQGRAGDAPPTDLGPADAPGTPGTPGGADPRLPEGRLLVVTGHRPPALGGYDANPVADGARARLAEVLAAKRQLHPDLVVLTGMGLGAEQLGAEAAADAGVPYIAVLPYPDPHSVWPAASQRRFEELLAGAAGRVLLQARPPPNKGQAGAALRRRDAWLARHAHEAVVVWDGDDPDVRRQVKALSDALGEEEVWLIDPRQHDPI